MSLPLPVLPGYQPIKLLPNTARVWEVVDLHTGEHRVAKLAADGPTAQQALHDESDVLDAIHRAHQAKTGEPFAPDIIRSYGMAGSYGQDFLVLEKLQPVQRYLSQRAATVDILFAGVLISDAYARVHKAGFNYNDGKLENIIEHAQRDVSQPTIKLLDFGSAMPRGEEWRREYTFGYASPQRLTGIIDSRGDVYSLGGVLYKLLSGQQPYGDPDHPLPQRQHVGFARTIKPVSLQFLPGRRRDFSAEGRTVIEAMLSPDAASRPSLLESRNGLEAAIRQIDSDVAGALPPPPHASNR